MEGGDSTALPPDFGVSGVSQQVMENWRSLPAKPENLNQNVYIETLPKFFGKIKYDYMLLV